MIEPGEALIRRILRRGVDSEEFRSVDMKYAAYLVLAPMLFLTMAMHSCGPWADPANNLNPHDYIAMQVDLLMHGLRVKPVSLA